MTATPVVEVRMAPYPPATVIAGRPDTAAVVEIETTAGAVLSSPLERVSVVDLVTAGPTGPAGPQGPAGPPGAGLALEQRFTTPATTWTIQHNLSTYPVVTVVDPNNIEVSADVAYTDMNTVVVTFAVPFAGTARLRT